MLVNAYRAERSKNAKEEKVPNAQTAKGTPFCKHRLMPSETLVRNSSYSSTRPGCGAGRGREHSRGGNEKTSSRGNVGRRLRKLYGPRKSSGSRGNVGPRKASAGAGFGARVGFRVHTQTRATSDVSHLCRGVFARLFDDGFVPRLPFGSRLCEPVLVRVGGHLVRHEVVPRPAGFHVHHRALASQAFDVLRSERAWGEIGG